MFTRKFKFWGLLPVVAVLLAAPYPSSYHLEANESKAKEAKVIQRRLEDAIARPTIGRFLQFVSVAPQGPTGFSVRVQERSSLLPEYKTALADYLKGVAGGNHVEVNIVAPATVSPPRGFDSHFNERLIHYILIVLGAAVGVGWLVTLAAGLRERATAFARKLSGLRGKVEHEAAKARDRAQVRQANRRHQEQSRTQATITQLQSEQQRLERELEGLADLWTQSRVETEKLRQENAALKSTGKGSRQSAKKSLATEAAPKGSLPRPPVDDTGDLEFL